MAESDLKTDTQALLARSDARGLRRLAAHAALIGGSAALLHASMGTAAVLAALPLHGVLLAFLFCALHETIHRTAFASRRINDWVARVCGFVLLLPPRYFRAFHLTHHRYTQDSLLDPELAAPKPTAMSAYLWHISGMPYWIDRIRSLARHASGRVSEPFIAIDDRNAIVREARMVLAGYGVVAIVSLWSGSAAALGYWVMPIVLGQVALRLFLLAEHAGCPSVADMFENSRTTLTNPAVRLVSWNMPYHTVHHRYPAVPFFNLPALHGRLSHRISMIAPSYSAFHLEYLRDNCRGTLRRTV